MIAFDTDLLVRLLVDDEPRQADAAVKLLENNLVLISRRVLLETEGRLHVSYNLCWPGRTLRLSRLSLCQGKSVRIVGLDSRGSSPGFDLAFVQGLGGSIGINPIPEPATLTLLSFGLLGIAGKARRPGT